MEPRRAGSGSATLRRTGRAIGRADDAGRRRGAGRRRAGARGTAGRRRVGGHQCSSLSLRAARSRADFARGFAATSPALGAIERRKTSSASGVRPQPQTGRSGGQMHPRVRSARKRLTRRSSSEWKEMPARRPSSRRICHASGSAASSWASSSLTAIRIAWKVRLAGWPPAKRAGAGIAALIASTSSNVGLERTGAHDRAGDPVGVALLAVLAQRAGEPAALPRVDDLAGGELLARVHPHVQRRVVGVGEAALERVDLHRGHAEVEVDEVGLRALLGEDPQAVLEVRADEARRGTPPRRRARRTPPRRAGRGRSRSACRRAPSRSATSRAWPAAPSVQSTATWPGCGSSASMSSPARTGTCVRGMSSRMAKGCGEVSSTRREVPVVGLPGGGVPELQAVAGADDGDVPIDARVLGQLRRRASRGPPSPARPRARWSGRSG